MFSKFCLLSSPHPLLLAKNVQLDGIPTKIKSNLNVCFTWFQGLIERTPDKSYKIQLSGFFYFLLFYRNFYSSYHFYDFLEFHSTFIWKKIFITDFPFFNGFTKTPHPLNAEQLKSAKRDESFLLMLFPYRSYLVELPNLIQFVM